MRFACSWSFLSAASSFFLASSRVSWMSFWRSPSAMAATSSPTSLPSAFIVSLASWSWSSAFIFASFSRSRCRASRSRRSSSCWRRASSSRRFSASSAAFFSARIRSCSSFRRSMTPFRRSASSWSPDVDCRASSKRRARFAARSGLGLSFVNARTASAASATHRRRSPTAADAGARASWSGNRRHPSRWSTRAAAGPVDAPAAPTSNFSTSSYGTSRSPSKPLNSSSSTTE
mmetsp:Transcript_27404/g.84565  ORF Transcript_27404/g.84565 Transcript_27404/m.84565 type:complete len:232 (+) Transcript_27404:614-1309(+)